MIGIGIDTGGTYTDAVVYDLNEKKILCCGKALTTHQKLEIGIAAALDTLNPADVQRAEMLALSTTLATNACLEGKGSRAKLLMIGLDFETLRESEQICHTYGFQDMDQLTCLNAKPEGVFAHPEEPDWTGFRSRIPELFADCGAVGVVQTYPKANGGRFEKQAKEILRDALQIPVTTAHDMFDEVNVLKRGAGTLLNARLIPLIEEFLQAVRHVMQDRGLKLPIAIVRSDGSLMSEAQAKECPVETLLSGPAASVVGGSTIAEVKDAVIVDMGGTTTDVAIVRDGYPVTARDGISIGPWKTMVKGLYVDTFLLGGDSAVRFRDRELYLDDWRVIPLSVLAAQHPKITDQLRELGEEEQTFTRMVHEFYVLQKDISGKSGFTPEEQSICAALKDGPLMLRELARAACLDYYHLPVQRLEEEGILLRSGLTPTDMMVLKGDFSLYKKEAAQAAVDFVALHLGISGEEIPDQVYELVERKLYHNIARILLLQKYPGEEKLIRREETETLISWSYEHAKYGASDGLLHTSLTTELPIVGVGAPIHIFLPKVAELLGTSAVIHENAPVANALGAIAGRIVTRVRVSIKAEYVKTDFTGYSVWKGEVRRLFREYPEAEEFAVRTARELVCEKAQSRGASASPEVKIGIRKVESRGILMESIVEAVAMDAFQNGK